jgi:purine-nucleoside phosphorylase
MDLYSKIADTAAFISGKIANKPHVGIILGSGLGGLIDALDREVTLHYSEIPHFPVSTVEGHTGALVFGKLGGKDVMLMAGRFHFYEGYNMQEVTFPVRVMKALGISHIIVSNAAGGMNPNFKIGDLMLISDHINLFPEHPLRGRNDERLGTRFPDMSEPYDRSLLAKALEIAGNLGYEVKKGVYAGLQGPTFETPAEYIWLHRMGADAVGMSTVPEVIVARHGGMKVFAVSVITDIGISETPVAVSHEEVLEAAHKAAPKLAAIVTELIRFME